MFASPWWVVVGATLGLMFSNGPVMFFTFGVFLRPVAEEFGWNRAAVAFAITVAQACNGLGSLAVGSLIDRWGARRVTLVMVTLFSATVMALSQTPASITAFILLYAIFGATGSGSAPLPYAKVISSWFEHRRGLALGIAMSGVGIGTSIVPRLTGQLIARSGWRTAYLTLGLVTFVVSFTAVLLFVREPPRKTTAALQTSADGILFSEAITASTIFWRLAVVGFFVAVAVNGSIGYMVPILTDRGVPMQVATSLLTASGLALIAGRVLSGYLLDRIFGPYVAAGFFLVPIAGILILASGAGGPLLVAAAIVLGLGIGAEIDILAFLAGRYFGLRAYGSIYGCLIGLFVFGSGVGPWLMSVCFEATGNYTWSLGGFAALLVLSALTVSSLGPYVYMPRTQALV